MTCVLSQDICVGDTPLIELSGLSPALGAGLRLLAKAEWHNPGGSVKDRAGLAIVRAAEREGKLSRGKVLLDATSGNTGIAYAWICARLGYKVSLAVPNSVTSQRRAILQAYGVELLFTSPLEGTDGAIREARMLYQAEPGRYFYADQYNNEANWKAHFDGTALEILAQTDRKLTHFVAGLGTSGTFCGTTRRLKKELPSVRCLSVEPDAALHGLDGMKHMESAIVPGIYDPTLADEEVEVSTEDAQEMTRRLAREDGLFVGVSSGANVHAAMQIAKRVTRPAVVVTILCDGGGRYMDDRFWSETR